MNGERIRDWQGAGFMVVAMAGYGFNDLMVKLASSTLPAGAILAIRSALAVALLFLLVVLRRELPQLRDCLRWRPLLRAALDTGATVCYVYALTGLALANAAALYQMTPIVFMLATALLLGERIPGVGWLGIAIGFLGVLCVVRPDAGILDPHALAVAGSVLFSAGRDLLMRGRPMPSPFCLALLSAAGTTVFGLAELSVVGAPASVPASALGLLALAAAAISLGYVFLALATATGSSGFVSPFRYSILVFATVFGVVVLGEHPDRTARLGIVLILAGGVTATLSRPRRGAPPDPVPVD
jgi:drug/metabolite transporter (DMT)-like permease